MAAKGLLLRLKDYQVKASAAEKNAVTIILNHPDLVIGKSIHEFADLAYASPATIISVKSTSTMSRLVNLKRKSQPQGFL